MQLMVIRHAIAEDPVAGLDDRERELTPEGRAKLYRVVAGLKAIDVRFDRVLTSPWKRALHTARAMSALARAAIETTPWLAQAPRPELLAQIAEHGETTAVIGHEPWLGELVGLLAFGDARLGDAIAIKKCGVVWLEGTATPGGMQIRAVLPPKLLRSFDAD
ncbi:MAG TPA: histidine phosphatase family protein [Kofleriaceae bacterium]|nr:histidine phosphatase family protein [Kofleriaceae bacterium]